MDKYGLVDLSNSQWLSRKLQGYTVKEVYDIVTKQPDRIDWKFQYHFYLMALCDCYLYKEIQENGTESPYWRDIIEKYNIEGEQLRLIKEGNIEELATYISNNRRNSGVQLSFGFMYHHFELFRAYNNITDDDAARSLARKIGIEIPNWYSNFSTNGKGFSWIPKRGQFYDLMSPLINKGDEELSYKRFCCRDPINNEPSFVYICPRSLSSLPLYEHRLLNDRDVPVFLIDSFYLAEELQRKYGEAYGTFLKESAEAFWKKILDFDNDPTVDTKVNELLEAIKKLQLSSYLTTVAYSNILWSSWFGGYDLLDKTDWQVLQKRDIYLFQIKVDIKTALEHFVLVARHIGQLPEVKLNLVWLEHKKDTLTLENNPYKLFSYAEALEEANHLGIEIDDFQSGKLAQFLRDQGRIPRGTSRYLIDPIIRLNSFTVVSGLEGSGKSWLAMFLGAALSVRGTLFYDWEVVRKGKVVYLADDEMDEDLLDDRRKVLQKLYRKYTENFVFESVHRIDLLDDTTQLDIENKINQHFNKMDSKLPSILILDHLNKLTDNEGNKKDSWPKLRKWIEDLNKKKITVIMVHHEFALGKMTGTVLIPQDAHTHIHVEHGKRELSKHEIEIVFTVPKNKGAKDQRNPHSIILNMERGVKFQMPDLPPQQEKERWKFLTHEARYSRIKELQEKMTINEIAKYFDCSKSTVEKFCYENKLSKRKSKTCKKVSTI